MSADSRVPGAYLSVSVQRHSGKAWVIAAGEIDMSTVARFSGGLTTALDTHPSALVVDLGEVSFMDATGITALVRARNFTVGDGDGAPLRVINLQPIVRRVLAITGVLPVMTGDD